MTNHKILLAEDSPEDAELTMAVLGEYCLANEVVHVADGADALDYIYRRGEFSARAADNPMLILLDLKMPRRDGMDVLRQVKSDPELRSIPVVLFTSSRQEQDLIDSYGLGANAYVVKPVKFEEFAGAVKSIGLFWVLTNQPPPGKVG
ncbi:MAG: response regulator [Deltaproteobacteria bacterium]|nr:response regulator [Deltaproteobacteria bacterium]